MLDRIQALSRLSRREYYADFWITPPMTLVYAVISLRHATYWWPVLFVIGGGAWTLYEYLVHRFVLHGPLWSVQHVMHHARHRDYIALHPVFTVWFYVMFVLIFGWRASALGVGFSAGYVWYALVHTMFHHAEITPEGLLWPAFERHKSHHRWNNVEFGISTGIWDRLFGTETRNG